MRVQYPTTMLGRGGRHAQPSALLQTAAVLILLVGWSLSSRAEEPPVFLSKWGTTGTGDGQFLKAVSIAVDGLSRIYVTDPQLRRIQEFSNDGGFLLNWGGQGSAEGQFENGPHGVTVDGSNAIYAAGDGRVQKFDASGSLLGLFPGGGIDNAVDAAGQNLYAVGANVVIQYTTTGSLVRQWTTTDDSRASNNGVAIGPGGCVYVVEGGVIDQVFKYTPDGTLVTQWGSSGTADGEFRSPYGIAVDADENVYVCDSGNARVQKFTSGGLFLTKWGTSGMADGQFLFASDVAVDGDGNVYVVDAALNRVQKFGSPPTPTIATSWGRIKSLYRVPGRFDH